MSINGRSLHSIEDLTKEDVDSIFSRARLFREEHTKRGSISHLFDREQTGRRIMAAVFLEPSTRTRSSFMIAAQRIGISVVNTVESIVTSSITKGETYTETIETIGAMEPDLMIVRYGDSLDIDNTLRGLKMPVINGGSGISGHPTQALLDAFTILESRGQLEGEKVLIVGDVLHSRVANSNLLLLQQMGAEVSICGPEEVLPSSGAWAGVQRFTNIYDGMSWASVCMGLRIQKERHTTKNLSLGEYIEQYRIDSRNLENLCSDGILMHPGPHEPGVDLSATAIKDPRSVIRKQVTNGVYVRAALISLILGFDVGQK